jgi:KaiC/GvpD/RAD55 family RecA-like ATPase
MEKIYLGSFGNGHFLKPQFEIVEDGNIRIIDNRIRFEEFPKGGTIFFALNDRDNIENYKNKIIKFCLDKDKDISLSYDEYNPRSNQYQISKENIIDLNNDEIIEVISLDIPFDDILSDKQKRKIKLDHRPNRKILLHIEEFCYGAFECIVVNDGAGYLLTIVTEGEKVNKYLYNDLDKYIYDAAFTMSSQDNLKFIYNINKLESINPLETIDFIDNEKLVNFIKDILANTDAIDNVAALGESFLTLLNNFSDINPEILSGSRFSRIKKLLITSEELKAYKVNLIDEYFRNNPNAENNKKEYLSNHEEIVEKIVKKDINYNDKKAEYERELNLIKNEIQEMSLKLEDTKNEYTKQQSALKEFQKKVVEDKKSELDALVNESNKELIQIKRSKEKIQNEYSGLESLKHTAEEEINHLKREKNDIIADINKKVIEWVDENRKSEIVDLLFSRLEYRDDKMDTGTVIESDKLLKTDKPLDIVKVVKEKLIEVGRYTNDTDIYNLLISITQNFILVFAGEPGTGKTSLCKILAKSMGLYNERFAEVSVERGWTSSKDLIGYYNPLTKTIEKTQTGFSKCMETLTREKANNSISIPYMVLLDEANLSPIEFYWSNFNYNFDNTDNQRVAFGNGTEYLFGSELKFLATINYDHTTEILSPRFLDRAWVILMRSISLENIIETMKDENDIENNDKMIDFESLKRFFGWESYRAKPINPVTKERLNLILLKFKSVGHVLSARSIKNIYKYCCVAEEYMSKELALDFAVAQKVLPLVDGNGREYGLFLKDLQRICKENQLEKCAEIIENILNKSEHDFYNFFSL